MRLKDLRNKQHLTQNEIAISLGVSQNTISQWKTGERLPRADKLPLLAKILDCTVDDLLATQPHTTEAGQ